MLTWESSLFLFETWNSPFFNFREIGVWWSSYSVRVYESKALIRVLRELDLLDLNVYNTAFPTLT